MTVRAVAAAYSVVMSAAAGAGAWLGDGDDVDVGAGIVGDAGGFIVGVAIDGLAEGPADVE